jgi:hypothetical protein
MPLPGSKRGTRANPASITTRTPSMVRLVSGDVGGQHHFALASGRRVDGGTLGIQVELAMQRAEQHIAAITERVCQLLVDPADLRLARQEHQHAAGFVMQSVEDGLHQARLDEFTGPGTAAPSASAPGTCALRCAGSARCPAARPGARLRGWRTSAGIFSGCSSRKQVAAIQAQGQCQVGVETAFVEFVEDQQAHAVQRRGRPAGGG